MFFNMYIYLCNKNNKLFSCWKIGNCVSLILHTLLLYVFNPFSCPAYLFEVYSPWEKNIYGVPYAFLFIWGISSTCKSVKTKSLLEQFPCWLWTWLSVWIPKHKKNELCEQVANLATNCMPRRNKNFIYSEVELFISP